MEKRTPHYPLNLVHQLLKEEKVKIKRNAKKGATDLGMNRDDILFVINNLSIANFYKSMTTYVDHRVWQDVYHVYTHYGAIYLKLTVIDEVIIVSFKEK